MDNDVLSATPDELSSEGLESGLESSAQEPDTTSPRVSDAPPSPVADPDLVRRLADLNGVATYFWTWGGEKKDVTVTNLLRTLEALEVGVNPSSTSEDVQEAIARTEDAPWLRTLPACTVARQGDWRELPVHVVHGEPVHCWYTLEDGTQRELKQLDRYVPPRKVDGQWRGEATFEIPGTLPLGYHTVSAEIPGQPIVSAPLLVVPQRIEPSVLKGGRRYWGVNAQIYSVQSHSSWGVGDAADLADLAAITARQGAEFLLVNPMHAAQPVKPMENSPYLPVSRQWLNVTYIRPEDIPEYSLLPDGERDEIERRRLDALNEDDDALLNRDRVWKAKRKALKAVFAAPRSIRREALFQAFCMNGGEALENHALWSALVDREGTVQLPQKYANPDTKASQRFAQKNAELIEFHKWLQWVAFEQLSACNPTAKKLGMPIGVMADMAVGIHPYGSEVWSQQDMFAPDTYVGAPPDMYSQQGQSWSQPPYSPRKLAESGYEPLRRVIRSTMQLAGALRIDHILGLFRLWWLPAGGSPADGTYVYYDHEATVGILLLEAARADAVLIGEDLGTVEPWVREYLASRGILGTSVLWFEKEDSGWPLHADQYRRDILGTVNTHDLPPTRGYIRGVHTDLRDRLGLLVEDVEDVRAADREEQGRMGVRLKEYGLAPEEPTEEEFLAGLHRYICRTPARLIAVSLVDAVGETRPQNLPGTDEEYPNWRVPLADSRGKRVWLEDLDEEANVPLFQVLSEELD